MFGVINSIFQCLNFYKGLFDFMITNFRESWMCQSNMNYKITMTFDINKPSLLL